MKVLKVLTVFLFFLLITASSTITVLSAQISWSNASGGNWSTGSNWTGGVVPGAADTALITLDGTYSVTLDADTTVAGLTLGGASGIQTLSLSSRTMNVNGYLTVNTNGVLSLSYSTIGGTSIIDNAGLITVQGVCNLNGTLTTQTSSILRLAYTSAQGSDLILTNGFTNNGLIDLVNTYYSRSAIIRSTNGPLVNSSTGTIDANSPTGGQGIYAEFDNQGTLNIG
ncbi:MAG: hypothetical protein GY855_10675, partial [candidate division Zixibacteria bacterium]|nr:hypothetical protein [candidate division Zixibacteria bacterium]